MKPFNFYHLLLGSLIGIQDDYGVTQFRGIPYGSIEKRFTQSTILTSLNGTSRDFTRWGPACPGAPLSDAHGGPLPHDIENPIRYHEDGCLQLTVTTPSLLPVSKHKSEKNRKKELLPVLVYIHGGGLSGGDAVSGLHDMAEIVRLSKKDGKPVLGVTIHYRLHFLGFTAIPELLSEARASNSPPSNFGLYDQRNAILWLKKYISEFGGDPDNITVFGESSGATSISFHMLGTQKNLFKRAVMMSGVAGTQAPMPVEYHESLFRSLCQINGIDPDASDRLERVRNLPVENIIEAVKMLPSTWAVLADPSFFGPTIPTKDNSAELMKRNSWVDSVIMGECAFEGYTLASMVKALAESDQREKLIADVDAKLGGRKYPIIEDGRRTQKTLLEMYDVSPGMDANYFWQRAMEFLGDLYISQPIHAAALSISLSNKRVYRYIYTLPNPFPGSSFYGVPHHFVDSILLKLNINFRLPPHLRKVATQHARYLINFSYGKEPWERYIARKKGGEEKIARINLQEGGGAKWEVVKREEDERAGRRYAHWEAIEKETDALMGLQLGGF